MSDRELEPGADFVGTIAEMIESAPMVIAVIGEFFLDETMTGREISYASKFHKPLPAYVCASSRNCGSLKKYPVKNEESGFSLNKI